MEWTEYLGRLQAGIDEHGPVREGVYAVTGYEGVDAHADRLGHNSANEEN